jgi:signal transduction histidine kinase
VKGIEFLVDCDGTPIRGDLTACRQIVTNLVSNAVKYSPDHSRVWLAATANEAGRVQISVRDEGPGITPEDQKKLFQPFTRLSARSAGHEHSIGLGLSIVKLMAEGMGGSVTCDSQPGAGATFTVVLPAE